MPGTVVAPASVLQRFLTIAASSVVLCLIGFFFSFFLTFAVLFCELCTSTECVVLGNLHRSEFESVQGMTLFASFVQHAFSHQTNLYSVCILMQIHYLLVVLFAFSWQCLPFSQPIYHSSRLQGTLQSLYLIFALGQTLRTTR